MSQFEFIFALFGLLLGLSLTEVLGGLARAIQVRLQPGSTVRIGWLTPLLGGFVLLDLLSFWQAAWVTRNVIAISGDTLLAVTLFASAYYLAAALVFPREARADTDFDAHFFRVRRIVLGVMLVLLACQIVWYASVPELARLLHNPLALGLTVVLVVLMTAALVARGKRWCELTMAALVARYVVVYLL
jgi:uncharacterized membrane protein